MRHRPSLPQLYGRIGGLRLRATHDPHEYTAAGRRAFLDRFEREVDPDGVLPPGERQARAVAARRAYMAALAAKSATKRRRSATSDRGTARIAELERRLAAIERRDDVATAASLDVEQAETTTIQSFAPANAGARIDGASPPTS